VLIDTHTHVHGSEFDADRDLVLERARSAGVGACVAIGTDVADSRLAIDLAQCHPDVYASVGVHPHETVKLDEQGLHALDELARAPRVVAFGEIGLDYYYLHSPQGVQQTRFREQIALAARHALPLIIHTRDAWDDTFQILDDVPHNGGVFHCFTGDLRHAEQAIARDFFISFSGIVTFAKSLSIQEVARTIDLDRVLIETDCPFLSPVPHRGRRNEPGHVTLVAQKLAELRGLSLQTLAGRTSANAQRCFPRLAVPR
jgi:TatD DNase family protein